MSSGKTHEKINLFLLAMALTCIIAILNKDLVLESFFIIIGYFLGTYLLSPDLDLKSTPYRRWGPLRFIWIPYQTFKHRSFWTHGFVISDIIRYAYLLIWFLIFSFIISLVSTFSFSTVLNTSNLFFSQYKTFFLFLFLGNILSTISHTSTDQVYSFAKKKRKIFTKKKRKR